MSLRIMKSNTSTYTVQKTHMISQIFTWTNVNSMPFELKMADVVSGGKVLEL